MASATFKQVWRRGYVQTAVMIIVIIAAVVGLWFGSQAFLGTPYPALAVASGSMCKVEFMACDGWSHPFDRTLHTGDLIIVKAIDPKDVHVGADPEGDIIIFHRPTNNPNNDELIVHRAVAEETKDGIIFFRTKGDGASGNLSDSWPSDYRGENYTWKGMISEKLLVGKVFMRIPWVGHLSLFMREPSAIYVVVAIIIILVVLEFVFPLLKKKPEVAPEENVENTSSP